MSLLPTFLGYVLAAATAPQVPVVQSRGAAEVLALIDDGRPARAEARARELASPAMLEGRVRSLEAAELLRLLARAMRQNGKQRDPETRRLSELAVAVAIDAAGEPSLEVADERYDLGVLCSVLGDRPGARKQFEEAIRQREALVGPDDPQVAPVLAHLAYLTYLENGDPETVRRLFARSRAIQEAALEPDHLDVAYRLGREAIVRAGAGDWDGARSGYERSIAIYVKRLRPGHPLISLQLHNLGAMCIELCDWAGATRNLEEALELRRTELGESHINVAWSATLLAQVRDHLGEREQARELWRTSLAVFEKSVGPEDPLLLLPLRTLAHDHLASGDLAAAESSIERSAAILAKVGDGKPFDLAALDVLRADLAARRGEEEAALAHLRHGLETLADVPLSDGSKADLHERTGRILADSRDPARIERGIQSLAQALELARREYLPDGLRTLWIQERLALALSGSDRHEEAFASALEVATLAREHLRASAAGFEERNALADAAKGVPGLPLCLWTAAHEPSARRATQAWDALIRSRAIVLVEMLERRRLAALSEDPKVGALARALTEARGRYADLAVRGRADPSQAAWRAQLEDARRARERAERDLIDASAGERASRAVPAVGYAEIASALPSGTALLSFARVEETGHGAAEYVALVRSPGVEAPAVRPLGDADAIDSLVTRALALCRTEGSEDAYRRIGDELRKRVWDPVEAALSGAREICVVPDGALVLLDLAALPVGEKAYLIERTPAIHYLSNERDILPPEQVTPGQGLLACGGPDFDHAGPVLLAQADTARPAAGWTPRGTDAVRSTPLSEIEFGELPMAAPEAAEVAALWDRRAGQPDAVVLTGAAATEEAFETRARGRAVLHLATHGFFLAAAEPAKRSSTRGVGPGAAAPAPADFALALETDHSLLSGLAFAGANSRMPSGGEDGILLAEEICALDLSGVRLTVLSACDTGLGQVQTGEGVFGLRRAFRVAGVRTLVTSLWPVVDETARARMVDFYGRWLDGGESVAQAIRSAALRILEDRRARGESTHPFHWAGFLAVGGRG